MADFWKNDAIKDEWWKADPPKATPAPASASVIEQDPDSFEAQKVGGETVSPEELAQVEKGAELFGQQKTARGQGEYWSGVDERIGHLMGRVVEPLTRPVSGVVGRAIDAPIAVVRGTNEPVAETFLKQSAINLPKATEAETTTGKIAAGSYNALGDLLRAFSSPDAVALLPAAQNKAVLSVWLGQMAGHQPERAARAVDLFKQGKTQEAVQEVATGIGELAMVELGRRHVMAEPVTAPLEVASQNAQSANAPATAEALRQQGRRTGIAASAREQADAQGALGAETGAVAIPEWMKAVGEWIRPRDVTRPPEMILDETHVVPRLQPYESEKANASAPMGVGTVPILGKVLDPRARASDPVDQAIIGHAASKAKGETIAALWAEQAKANRPASLVADEAGTIPLEGGARGYLSDVIEAEMRQPGSQPLLPEQRQWITEVWEPLNRDLKSMLSGENVKGFEVDENGNIPLGEGYFPRPAIGKRDVEGQKPVGGGQRVGSKQFFQKERLYPTEAEGAVTTIYEPDVVNRVAALVSRAYKAVADTRLANDETLGGRSVKERFEDIQAERGGVLDGMTDAEKQATLAEWRSEASHPLFMKEGTVDQPAFRDKIFPIETARKLQKHYADYTQSKIGKLSNISRAFQLTLDMSAPFNQGLILMYRNPKAWGKAVADSWRSLFNEQRMGEYLNEPENAAAARELAQLGVSLRRMQDFAQGKSPDNIPGIKQTGRAFGVFMDVAKIEHWKSIRETQPRESWPELAQALDSTLLSGRLEPTGITPRQAHYERLAFLAPAYYRGGIDFVATALQRGVGGAEIRKGVGAFTVGITATAVAGMLAAGLTWEEIGERLNPSKGKFMRVPITIGDRKLEAGFGNVVLSFSRLLGETVEAAQSDNPIKTGAENNPWVRWLRGKLGPIPSFGTDVAVGRDILGKDISIKRAAAQRFTPITVQQGSGEGTPSGKGVDAALSFLGLQAYPQNVRDLMSQERERLSQEKHGRGYESLPFSQQAAISAQLKKDERFKPEPSSARQRELAYNADIDRVNRIGKGLGDKSKEKLVELAVNLTGYDASISTPSGSVPLTRKQAERYEQLITEEYDRVIGRLPTAQFMRMEHSVRQKKFNEVLAGAKERARARLVSEQGKNAP